MNIIEAVILGIVQGLTEFLPVSSSGHIQIGEAILGIESADSLSFTIMVHFATVLSTMIVFRKDILSILKGLFSKGWNEDKKFVLMVVISTLPAAAIGLFFKERVEALFGLDVVFVGWMLIVTGLLLMATIFAPKGDSKIGIGSAIFIGLAQALAILPGVSRSGATISTALYLGIEKSKATRFSFLMVIPLIVGSAMMDLKDLTSASHTEAVDWMPLLAGTIAAFLAGLIACQLMINIVKKGKIYYFAIYCTIIGIIAIFFG